MESIKRVDVYSSNTAGKKKQHIERERNHKNRSGLPQTKRRRPAGYVEENLHLIPTATQRPHHPIFLPQISCFAAAVLLFSKKTSGLLVTQFHVACLRTEDRPSMRKTTEKETKPPRALVEAKSTPPKKKKSIQHTARHAGAVQHLVERISNQAIIQQLEADIIPTSSYSSTAEPEKIITYSRREREKPQTHDGETTTSHRQRQAPCDDACARTRVC